MQLINSQAYSNLSALAKLDKMQVINIQAWWDAGNQ